MALPARSAGRQRDREGRAGTELAVDRDLPAMQVDDVAGQGQADAGTGDAFLNCAPSQSRPLS
jgi:hypothetical protein